MTHITTHDSHHITTHDSHDRASLGLHEYDESRLCFTSLLDLQQARLERERERERAREGGTAAAEGGGAEKEKEKSGVEAAAADIKTTEKWLKKLKKAEIDYKNRDKSIGKRISKGLFEGKDEIIVPKKEGKEKETVSHTQSHDDDEYVVVPEKNENEKGSTILPNSGSDVAGRSDEDDDTTPTNVPGPQGTPPPALLQRSPPHASKNTGTDTDTDTSAAAAGAKAGAVHPLVRNLHTYQLYYYSAVLAASVAIGLQIL